MSDAAPLEQDDTLAVPKDCLVGLARDYADLMAAALEPPLEYWYFSALTCMGHLFANLVTISSSLSIRPTLFTVLVGESGQPRKSTAAKMAIQHLLREIRFHPSYKEERRVCLPSGAAGGIIEGVASDAGLIRVLSEQANTLLVLDELALLGQKGSDGSSVLYPMIAGLFDRDRYEHPLKKDPIRLTNAHLSLLAACTTDTYETIFDPLPLSLGFPNRLWLVPGVAKRKHFLPPALGTRALRVIQEQVVELYERVKERQPGQPADLIRPSVPLTLSPAADALFQSWYINAERETGIEATRLESYGHRLALLLALSMGHVKEIPEEVAQHVVTLLDWQHRVRVAHAPVEGTEPVVKMEQRIRKVLSGAAQGLKIRGRNGLKDRVHASRVGLWAFDKALENLRRHGEVKSDRERVRLAAENV